VSPRAQARAPAIDVARAREETPGCANVIHFNNAGASLQPRPVLDTVLDHLRLEAEIGAYEAAEREDRALERVYDSVAALVGASREEIAVVENSTRAWDMAFYSLRFSPGDRILTSAAEYASNYISFLQVARRTGAVIDAVPSDPAGQVSVEALERAIDPRVKLISLTWIPTNGGLVNPARAVGAVARRAGVPYLLDACQAVGQIPIDVAELGCDMLAAAGRKFLRGPRGVGFLYVKREFLENLEPPLLDMHAATWVARDRYEMRPDARRFETFEYNVASKLGLGKAVEYAMGWGIEAIRDRAWGLAAELRRRLSALPGVTVRDIGAEQCAIVTFTIEGRDPEEIKTSLAGKKINVTVTGTLGARLDMEARGLTTMVRASVHYYNTEDEIERFCAALAGRQPPLC
jgi:selenocysteine lyase/cysteine desulfurase